MDERYPQVRLAGVNGNNAWVAANMNVAAGAVSVADGGGFDNYETIVDLTLDPGQSVSLLHFAFLARDDTCTPVSSDLTRNCFVRLRGFDDPAGELEQARRNGVSG